MRNLTESPPQVPHELRDGDGVGVVADQPQHEDAVLSQIVVHERREVSALVVPDVDAAHAAVLVPLHQHDVLLHVAPTVRGEEWANSPREETDTGHGRHKDHPEPEEQVDLLVEQVDGQHALHGVALHIAESPHLQVAHGDAGEALGLGPVGASQKLADNIDPVQVVVDAHEAVEDE